MTLMRVDDALANAQKAAGFLSKSRLRIALAAAQPQSARLVQRIDHEDKYYYVVIFMTAGKETARVVLDAFDGKLREASGIGEAGKTLKPYVSNTEAMTRLVAKTATYDEGPFRIREGTIGLHPVLVWKPCLQSSSPLLPFYQFSVGSSFVYVRADGEFFPALTGGPVNRAARATGRAASENLQVHRPRR